MPYRSRLHRHRNSLTPETIQKKPFFSARTHDGYSPANRFFQKKFSLHKAGDSYEPDADAIGHTVTSNSSSTTIVQKEKINALQKPAAPVEDERNGSLVSADIASALKNSSGKGTRLPAKMLSKMNASFGVDFSSVNIHHDAEAAEISNALQAHAFTHGNNIYFNRNKYNPGSSEGKFLLAHELTHVIQQGTNNRNGSAESIQKSPAAAVAISAAVVAATLCAYKFFDYALNNYPDKSDKWKHCWVSCKIAAWCGGNTFSLIIGAGKEGLDAICDAYGGGCKAEFLDFVADLEGIACANIPLLPCTTCCDNTTSNL